MLRLLVVELGTASGTFDSERAVSVAEEIARIVNPLFRSTERKQDNRTIKLAKEYISRNLHRSVTLAEVAKVVHYCPTYFSEYFKEKTGETFMQYVTRMKIEKAKKLLANPVLKIHHISESVGYQTPRSFAKMFKAATGFTPSEYRNQPLCPEIYRIMETFS